MKYQYSFLLFLAGFILQTTVMNHFNVFGVSPNIILCLVVLFSFLFEGYHGIVFGLIFGLITDVCFAPIIGIAGLSNFIVALFCIEMKRYLYKESIISILIVSAIGTISYGVIYFGIIKILGIPYNLLELLKMQGMLLLYNEVTAIVMYYFMSRRAIKHRSDLYMYRNTLQEARSLSKT